MMRGQTNIKFINCVYYWITTNGKFFKIQIIFAIRLVQFVKCKIYSRQQFQHRTQSMLSFLVSVAVCSGQNFKGGMILKYRNQGFSYNSNGDCNKGFESCPATLPQLPTSISLHLSWPPYVSVRLCSNFKTALCFCIGAAAENRVVTYIYVQGTEYSVPQLSEPRTVGSVEALVFFFLQVVFINLQTPNVNYS